jgi:hypothetical protein
MTLRACLDCGCPCHPGQPCPRCGHVYRLRRHLATTQRGYGTAHQRMRAMLLPFAIGRPCPLCGQTMRADEKLDLDHSTPLILDSSSHGDRITHAKCNRGGRVVHANARDRGV